MKELRQKTLRNRYNCPLTCYLKQVIKIKINAYFCLRVDLRNHDELEPPLKAKDKRVSNNILMYLLNQCLFLFYFLFYFFFNFIFKFYIIVLVLPYIKMNLPQVYMCSPSWTLLPPPSPYHPSGLSQCTSPKHPVSCHQTWTGNSFHTWYFTCFNAILPYLPTLSLSHSP